MDGLDAYFAEHLEETPADNGGERVLRMAAVATRYLLFKVGPLRLALASTDVAAVTRTPEGDCDYLAGAIAVPARYRAAATVDAGHDCWIHLAGTRLGLGPCRADGDIVLPAGAIVPPAAGFAEQWILGTIADPPSLVLDRGRLCTHLLAQARA
ncbi:MAG: hypothetical protein RLW61_19625 [Gammaproteobacteria bacterium]